ncbi:hypothetical protein D030_1463B, partial [Vibrio parahaemolyticus AQ3810]
AMLPTVEQ